MHDKNSIIIKKKKKPNLSEQVGFAFNPKNTKPEHSLLFHQAEEFCSLARVLSRLLLPVGRSLPLSTDNFTVQEKGAFIRSKSRS